MQDLVPAIAQALAPICFGALLGWSAGKRSLAPIESGKALARFVVVFALPTRRPPAKRALNAIGWHE
jgi:malonate transporter